jgi:hypothetical protein
MAFVDGVIELDAAITLPAREGNFGQRGSFEDLAFTMDKGGIPCGI